MQHFGFVDYFLVGPIIAILLYYIPSDFFVYINFNISLNKTLLSSDMRITSFPRSFENASDIIPSDLNLFDTSIMFYVDL